MGLRNIMGGRRQDPALDPKVPTLVIRQLKGIRSKDLRLAALSSH